MVAYTSDATIKSPAAAREQYKTDTVTSKDGTTISYRQMGSGTGLVILHGAMESSQSHMQLAEALADTFTLYLPDRRGRGLSGAYGSGYSIQKEVEDMDALLSQTGAHFVFGISSGAIISLQSALTLPAIRKAAIFEPPLIVNNSFSTDFIARYDAEIAQGDFISALVTGMQGSQIGPSIFNVMPRWLLKRFTAMMIAGEEKNLKTGDVTMKMLAPTLHYDFQLVVETRTTLERFKAIQADVLLLGGSNSPAYLKTALNALEGILPHVPRIELPGVGHGASGNANRGGKPEQVAQVLRQFFA